MASATSLNDTVVSLLQKSFPSTSVATDSDPVKLSAEIYPETHYTDAEKAEISQWLITSSHIGLASEDDAKAAERLSTLNRHLSTRTTVLGSKPSVADVALFARLVSVVKSWSPEERTGEQGYHHIVRYVDFLQNAEVVGLKLDDADKLAIEVDDVKFTLKPIDAKAEKERKKKEKEAAAAAATAATPTTLTEAEPPQTQDTRKSKKDKAKDKIEQVDKKDKKPKPAKETAPEKPLSPSLIDLRVGHILHAIAHPNADSLYISTIAVGDPPGTEHTSEYDGQVVRTVCSGLAGLVPLAEMQNRKIVAVCNLKPVTMRGVKSAAMVLAASPRVKEGEVDAHKGPVELVQPPQGSVAGDRVFFEGWEGEPEKVLNPKKKVWESLQPGFVTTEEAEVGFRVGDVEALREGERGAEGVARLRTKGGVCVVGSLKGATVR
ncbi:nucleic acid-binding protein [Patellaria atrata CBS 101060]|uniref:Nucleic acid-binding protein n=1 Tax=Patellaria atrata CBS 101060 TaxID=1346257 RepID=A0A9P4VSS6_9PEZI|nr:nucleic acid-binding protein [Patellaria atrata CBS 101060]